MNDSGPITVLRVCFSVRILKGDSVLALVGVASMKQNVKTEKMNFIPLFFPFVLCENCMLMQTLHYRILVVTLINSYTCW